MRITGKRLSGRIQLISGAPATAKINRLDPRRENHRFRPTEAFTVGSVPAATATNATRLSLLRWKVMPPFGLEFLYIELGPRNGGNFSFNRRFNRVEAAPPPLFVPL